MAVSLVLSSTSFTHNDVIPQQFKSRVACGGNNRSPQLSWTLYGAVIGHLEYFNLYVINTNLPGNGPGGKFLHWGVTNISRAQSTIAENGFWLDPNTIVLESDWQEDDNNNGWNGPCASNHYLYNIVIEAKVRDIYADYIWGSNPPADLMIRSNTLSFLDRPTNLVDVPTTVNCGDIVCPPGYDLVGNVCQEIITENAIVNATFYYPAHVPEINNYASWGIMGTKFIRSIEQYALPIKAYTSLGGLNADLIYDNTNALVTYDYWGNYAPTIPPPPQQNHELWGNRIPIGGATAINDSRFLKRAVWTNSFELPINEWIGFTYCINIIESHIYCIGLAGDNNVRVSLNGQLLFHIPQFNTPYGAFSVWHILEVTMQAGRNIVTIEGRNSGMSAGFGFEIYKATVDQLQALNTTLELLASDYIIYSSIDPAITEFDVGEASGYSCSGNLVYSNCITGQCVEINKITTAPVLCCWVIENCLDSTEHYNIQLDASYTEPLYINSVYTFSGNLLFIDETTGLPKCFKVINKVVCSLGESDVVDVTVLNNFGEDVSSCLQTEMFRSCDKQTLITVTLQQNQPTLIEGNIYKLNIGTACYTYMGRTGRTDVDYNGVSILQDYETDSCEVCLGCLRFKHCDSSTEILIKLSVGEDNPNDSDINTIYELIGDPAIDGLCWKFLGYEDCIDPDYLNIGIVTHYACTECGSCIPYYKITACNDPEDVTYCYWTKAEPLDTTRVYIFDFNPGVCCTAELQYPLCEPMTVPIYDASNVVMSSTDCSLCNTICYKVIDCETQNEFLAIPQTDMSRYANRIIRYVIIGDDDSVHCGTVKPYMCINETLPEFEIIIENCFADCEDCLTVPVIPEPEFSIARRNVAPGENVSDCKCSNNEPNCFNNE